MDLKHSLQTQRQIEAYENKLKTELINLSLGSKEFTLEIDPFVASPTIMNSGVQAMNFLKDHPELIRNKVVNDMGTGSGILGITAAMLGAKKVFMEDIDPVAVNNAKKNIKNLSLENVCEAFVSDLFSNYGNREKAEVHIFNHPYFPEKHVKGKEWTRMMFGGKELLKEYFRQVTEFSTPNAIYIFSWIKLAENKNEIGNNPSKRGEKFGFKTVEIIYQDPVKIGVQQEPFEIHILKKV